MPAHTGGPGVLVPVYESSQEHMASGATYQDVSRNQLAVAEASGNFNSVPPFTQEADIEAKLRALQKTLGETEGKLRMEQEHVRQLEEQLSIRDAKSQLGTDLEAQLMANLVGLRQRVVRAETEKDDEDRRLADAEAGLQQEQLNAKNSLTAKQKAEEDKKMMQDKVDRMKKRIEELEGEIADRKRKHEDMDKGLSMISIERDEALELLERAVSQKEQIQRKHHNEFNETQRNIDSMIQEQKREQYEFRKLLSEVDSLLAKFGRAHDDVPLSSDALRELLSVRDKMRQIVTQKQQVSQNLEGPFDETKKADKAGSGSGGKAQKAG